MLEAEPFIEMMKKYNPKSFDEIKIPKERSEFYTIDFEKFFSAPDQQYFVGSFRIEDIYSESGQQIMLLRPSPNYKNRSFLISDRKLYFKISCDMDISEIGYLEEIFVIFTVDKILSTGPEEFTRQNTSINGDCLAAIEKFQGLEKLIEGD